MEQPEIPVQAQTPDYALLRKQLNDYDSTFYCPHLCPEPNCKVFVIRHALEQGGECYEQLPDASYELHVLHRREGTMPCPPSSPSTSAERPYSRDLLDRVAEEAVKTGMYRLVPEVLEKLILQKVLEQFGGNQCHAAKAMGMHRNTISRKMNELGIPSKHGLPRERREPYVDPRDQFRGPRCGDPRGGGGRTCFLPPGHKGNHVFECGR